MKDVTASSGMSMVWAFCNRRRPDEAVLRPPLMTTPLRLEILWGRGMASSGVSSWPSGVSLCDAPPMAFLGLVEVTDGAEVVEVEEMAGLDDEIGVVDDKMPEVADAVVRLAEEVAAISLELAACEAVSVAMAAMVGGPVVILVRLAIAQLRHSFTRG